MQDLRRNRSQQKVVENSLASRRHDDQVGVVESRRFHYFPGRVTSEQHARNGNSFKLRPQHLGQSFLCTLNDLSVQVARGNLVSTLQQAVRIAERRHHMQQNNLRMKAPREPGSLARKLFEVS